MDRININLNPKQKKAENAFVKMFSYYAGVGVCLLLVILIILGVFIAIRAAVYKYRDIKWSKWKEKYAQMAEIKKEIAGLESERNEFQKILTPKNQMADIFEDIFSSLPRNMWFNNIGLKNGALDMRGYVVRIDEDYLVSLEKFINSLKEKSHFSSRFKKINIKDSQKNEFNGVEILEFYIECVS